MKHTQLLSLLVTMLFSSNVHAQWIHLATGINDRLTGVWFWGTTGVVCGDHGIYFTTTGGAGASSWTRLELAGTPVDSQRYENTRFTALACMSNLPDVVYASGNDTVNGTAVIMRLDINTQEASFPYIGPTGSRLNDIAFNSGGSRLFAAGDQGLLLRSPDLINFTVVPTGTLQALRSISSYGSAFLVGGDEILLDCTDGNSALTFTTHVRPSFFFHDVQATIGTYHFAVGPYGYRIQDYLLQTSFQYNYDPLPLNGRDITILSNSSWVATDHGIYKGNNSPNYYELQPSTAGLDLHSVFFLSSTQGWAAGANGIVLYTTNGGGPTLPFTRIGTPGGCVGEPLQINAFTGTGINCRWYIDGVQVNTMCNGGNSTLTVNNIGAHELMFIANSNGGGLSDTSITTFMVVAPPEVNLQWTVSDTVLCKREATQVTIFNSQTDVIYSVKDVNLDEIIATGTGTGADLVLLTDSIDSSTVLVIHARSTVADCSRTFPDSIHVRVEETTARLHATLVNAMPTETVDLYQQCTDAQNWSWSLGPTASITSSDLPVVAGVTFSTLGPTSIELICWSDQGCYDTTMVEGPYIYLEPPPDSCWAFAMPGRDTIHASFPAPHLRDAISTGDGFLISGGSYRMHLPSRIGRSLDLPVGDGGFLAKYSYSGTLKWVVHSLGQEYLTVNSIDTFPGGDILIVGNFHGQHGLRDNVGDSIPIRGIIGGYLVRLDRNGRYIWQANSRDISWNSVRTDNTGNVYVVGQITELYVAGSAIYFHNDIPYPFITTAGHEWTVLMKTDGNGAPIWQTYFENHIVNPGGNGVLDMDVDALGNIYLAGGVEISTLFRSANGGPTHLIDPPGVWYGEHLFVSKFDTDGQFLWSTSAEHNHSSSAFAIKADEAGNTYITGFAVASPTAIPVWVHSDGSTSTTSGAGRFFVAKLDPIGHLTWHHGSTATQYGTGSGLHLDADGILVVGNFHPTGANGYLTSTGTPQLWCAGGPADYFVAHYDVTGGLQQVYHPWSMIPNLGQIGGPTPILRDTLGHIIYMGSFASETGLEYYGDTIVSGMLTGFDGFIAKTGHSCTDFTTPIAGSNTLLSNGLLAYPNPVVDELHLSLPHSGTWDITLADMLGRTVRRTLSSTGELTVMLEEWMPHSSGVMLIIAEHMNERLTFRIVRSMP